MKRKVLRRESVDGIVQEIRYNEHERDDELFTTINSVPDYHGYRSFSWVDVRRREPIFEEEIEKARQAMKAKKPSASEVLYKELGFTEVDEEEEKKDPHAQPNDFDYGMGEKHEF